MKPATNPDPSRRDIEFPDEADAVQWHLQEIRRRRIMGTARQDVVFGQSGREFDAGASAFGIAVDATRFTGGAHLQTGRRPSF